MLYVEGYVLLFVYLWNNQIGAERNDVQKNVTFSPKLSSWHDWWPKRCPAITYSLGTKYNCTYVHTSIRPYVHAYIRTYVHACIHTVHIALTLQTVQRCTNCTYCAYCTNLTDWTCCTVHSVHTVHIVHTVVYMLYMLYILYILYILRVLYISSGSNFVSPPRL